MLHRSEFKVTCENDYDELKVYRSRLPLWAKGSFVVGHSSGIGLIQVMDDFLIDAFLEVPPYIKTNIAIFSTIFHPANSGRRGNVV